MTDVLLGPIGDDSRTVGLDTKVRETDKPPLPRRTAKESQANAVSSTVEIAENKANVAGDL